MRGDMSRSQFHLFLQLAAMLAALVCMYLLMPAAGG